MVRIRITPAEKQQLAEAARQEGLTLSDYMRSKSINATPRLRMATPERAAFIRALAELGKLGSNVNQIARAINRKLAGAHEPEVSGETIRHSLEGVDALTQHLINLVKHGH